MVTRSPGLRLLGNKRHLIMNGMSKLTTGSSLPRMGRHLKLSDPRGREQLIKSLAQKQLLGDIKQAT